jgi:hypothetical protein
VIDPWFVTEISFANIRHGAIKSRYFYGRPRKIIDLPQGNDILFAPPYDIQDSTVPPEIDVQSVETNSTDGNNTAQPIESSERPQNQEVILHNSGLQQNSPYQKIDTTKMSLCYHLGQKYIDLAPYFNMPITEVAKELGAAPSTLTKRVSTTQRRWPYRRLRAIDSQLLVLLKNRRGASTMKRTVTDNQLLGSIQNCKENYELENESIEQKIKELLVERNNIVKPMYVPYDFVKCKK